MVSRGWAFLGQFILFLGLLGLPALGLPVRTRAQGIHTVIEPRARVFPDVGAGVTAIQRAADGRYYILARPANTIRIYSPDGKRIGSIPKAGSGAALRYAVGIDVTPSGLIAVADRGANAIEVFRPDGSLVSRTPVFAPTSVVALWGGAFAVTTLRCRHLVRVIDEQGAVLESFGHRSGVGGNPQSDADADTEELFGAPPPKPTALHDSGTITGDGAGGIYFAFRATPNPTLRKYNRYGYRAYQTSLPKSEFGPGAVRSEDRVQFLFGLSNDSFSSQEGGWLSFGSSKDLKFGTAVGSGIGESLERGFGLGQAIELQDMSELGSRGATGGPLGQTFSGEVNRYGTTFEVGTGPASTFRSGGGLFGRAGGETTNQGALLQFSGSGGHSSNTGTPVDTAGWGHADQLGVRRTGESLAASTLYSSNWLGAPLSPAPGGMGPSAPFMLGSSLDGLFSRPPGSSGNAGAARQAGSQKGGPAAAGFDAGYRGFGALAFTAGLRVNLGRLKRGSAERKAEITAMAVDPQTHDVWATIGNTLVEFNSNGTPVGVYYLSLAGGERLKATALLVEPDRLLIAVQPWGIYDFPRPDKPQQFQMVSRTVEPHR